ncbi:PREDICTED: uncharacterized protein LOC107109803 [Gekko japonicus]|uniref:Uncharacterized protein LOC107109803 n=1 Tax=Gekko japonicus TaxID=146911 RepID=A0ABM1JX06_GEKJA|nr:PREDICTED: uncharacterized protein LOC107109803 [Gekko japonicus]
MALEESGRRAETSGSHVEIWGSPGEAGAEGPFLLEQTSRDSTDRSSESDDGSREPPKVPRDEANTNADEPLWRPALTPVGGTSHQCTRRQEQLQSKALQALEGSRQASEEIARLMKEALASQVEARRAEREARHETSEALLEALREETRNSERLLAASKDLVKTLRESDKRFQERLSRHSEQMERLVSWLVPVREQKTTSAPRPPMGGSVPHSNLADAECAPPSKSPRLEGASNPSPQCMCLCPPAPKSPRKQRCPRKLPKVK